MKGKIIYTAVVEKEIEIPNEIIEIEERSWWSWTSEEEKKVENFSNTAWSGIEFSNRIGIYYEEDGQLWAIEEY